MCALHRLVSWNDMVVDSMLCCYCGRGESIWWSYSGFMEPTNDLSSGKPLLYFLRLLKKIPQEWIYISKKATYNAFQYTAPPAAVSLAFSKLGSCVWVCVCGSCWEYAASVHRHYRILLVSFFTYEKGKEKEDEEVGEGEELRGDWICL